MNLKWTKRKTIKYTFPFLILFLLNPVDSFAQTLVHCENTGYANKTLEFYQVKDPVSNQSALLFSLAFDKNGKASAQVDLKKATSVFSDFGVYRGIHFLEPGKTSVIVLPPWREKNFAEEKNPYFEPLTFWIKTTNSKHLSNQIIDFTLALNELSDKYFSEIYFRQSKKMYDSLVSIIHTKFGSIQNKAFQNHLRLELKMVEVEAFRLKPKSYSGIFSEINADFWTHPSFVRLFETTFKDQLSFEAKDIKGSEIAAAVNSSDINFLLNHLKSDYLIDGDMARLALLKMLYDGFYSGDFSNEAILKTVGASTFSASKNETVKQAAKNSAERFKHLQPGTQSPVICLKNLSGDKKCSNQAKEKFKYLVFADTEMIVCKEQLKYLTKIEERFQKYLDIFIILRNTNQKEAAAFSKENSIPGTIVMDAQGEFIKKYSIKSFPQCFLLNENHEIQFTHTKAPLDGFEQQFGKFLQQELFLRQRNQSR